jgi:hypothetical protein
MSPHEQNDDLGRLLNDAVSDIEPRSGIQAIRARTSAKESVMTLTRNWIFGAFGAAVATAAVITGVVVAGNNNPEADDPGVSGTPTGEVSDPPSDDPTDEPTDEPTDGPTDPATSEPPASGSAVPVYYVGETPQGPRLYREFQTGSGDKATAAADLAVSGTPLDPDYRSPWPEGTSVDSVSSNGDFITVDVVGDVHDRPSGMSEEDAALAIEQVIFTVQGAVGQGRLPVQFMLNGSRTDQILGQPASEPLSNGTITDTLALVNITTPAEGEVVSDDAMEVSGVANSFETHVVIRLQRYEGTHIALEDFITAEGCCEEKLFPFSKSVDISDVEPGKYILMASTDDPSGGEEGFGPHTDTKIITIQ